MSEVSTIDTRYNGYRFRSRLEARWAIFFDQMGVTYLFEPEGFELGGVKYLPDFRLTEGVKVYGETDRLLNVWAEVKPSLILDEEDRQKLARFVQQTDSVALILSGDPEPGAKVKLIAHKANGGEWRASLVAWAELSDGEAGLLDLALLETIDQADKRLAVERLTESPRLMAAYAAARDARFEYGETPVAQPFRYEVRCATCGTLFVPSLPYHRLCYSCYIAEKSNGPARATVTDNLSASLLPASSKSNRKWAYGLGALLLVLLVIGAGILFANQSRSDATREEAPDATMDEAFQSGVDEPISAPVRSSSVEIGAKCECTENRYDCGDFETRVAAQACFDTCFPQSGDIHYLDANRDGEACERLP